MIIAAVPFHSTKPELKFCVGINPTRGESMICDGENLDGENLWQWSRLDIRHLFNWATNHFAKEIHRHHHHF